ncbi:MULTISPECIES: kelch repeat-containing protein [Myxococcaceae]|uniref:Kelch repeat-containing protein n=1 Tax=Myxococcaceae TaxID=31 RepID=UPI0018901272|nr:MULTISPECIES: kelch repeat-containing protein [Myxococcaceae]MBF5044562.1 hypothetical protein [Simulacricoccus sp. 17bor-14]
MSPRHALAVLCFTGALLAACRSAAPAPAAEAARSEGTWEPAPPMLHARSAHAVVSDGKSIYALAGSGAGGVPVREVERFDGTRWQVETQLPGDGLNAPAAVVLGDTLYLVGGFSGVSNLPTDRVYRYSLSQHTWSEAAPLPAPRGGHAAVVLDGKLHVLGGGNSQSTLALHSVYDPATNTWSERAPLPRSEGSPAALAVDGKLWAIGGRSGPSDFGEVYLYDPAQDRWSSGPPIPPRGTAGAVRYRGALYVIGGESQALGRSLDSVLRLDPTEGTWRDAPPLPTARNYARAVLLGDAIYVVGGSPLAGRSHSSEGSTIVERFRFP